MLPDGHQIRQHLAGMAEVGQSVDDGDRAVLRQILHLFLGKGADHNGIQIPGENPGCILHRLAPANLQIGGGEHEGVAAQLVHTGFKGNAGAGGGFLEDHAQGHALQRHILDAVFGLILELIRQVEEICDLFLAEIQKLEQMVHGSNLPFYY